LRAGALALRRATAQDAALLFEWANEPQARAMSFSSEPIAWQAHCAWLAQKLADARCLLFVVTEAEGTPVGQVRLDLEPAGVAVISVSVDRRHRGRGIGRRAIELAVAEAVRRVPGIEVHAYLRPDNAASLRAFACAGFGAPIEARYRGNKALRVARRARAAH
jgi:RimJ/RimL family protein N-acetyltransferase